MLWICKDCGTAYAPDSPRCPHCGGKKHGTDHDQAETEAPAEAGKASAGKA